MRMISRVAMTTALLLPMVAGPAAAQNYRWDLGVNGGYSWYTDVLDGEDLAGATDAAFDDAKFDAGWLLGAQIGFWARPNIGLRLNGTYTDRPFEAGDAELIGNVNLWSGSLDLLWRFRRPNSEWMGTEVLPYLALGLGAKWINPAGDPLTCLEDDGDTVSCTDFVITDPPVVAGPFVMPDQTRFMGLVGLGTDVRLAPSFALRLEVNDRIYEPKVFELDPADNSLVGESLGETVHEIAGQVGLHLLLGLQRPRVVSVVPAPAPPPPPPPPPPAPEPVEEAISVCVIDPSAPNGVEMRTAYFRPATRDTVVIVNGDRVPLDEVVGPVTTVRNASWFVRGEPLVLTVGDERFEFLTYQGERYIDADRVAFLGTINGYPVYADRDEVADIIGELNDLRRAQATDDLSRILAERNDLRDELNDISYLYAPLESTGCVFQALQPLEPVQKGK